MNRRLKLRQNVTRLGMGSQTLFSFTLCTLTTVEDNAILNVLYSGIKGRIGCFKMAKGVIAEAIPRA